MGTFHDNMGELHGITVVVDTSTDKIYVGRCEVMVEGKHILLNEADDHTDGDNGKSKDDYISQVAKVGFWKKHDRLMVKADDITSVKPLKEYM